METEAKKREVRLMFWAILFLVLSIIVIVALPLESAKEIFSFFKEIIIHLII